MVFLDVKPWYMGSNISEEAGASIFGIKVL
jgi:hypothetical protein